MNWNISIPKKAGPTAIFENKEDKQLAEELIGAYSSKDLKLREKFGDIKI
jgi:hypothetical protein